MVEYLTVKNAIENTVSGKDGFKKVFRFRWMETFKAVRIRAVKSDCFKAVRELAKEALECIKAVVGNLRLL